ncbi:MAG: lasso RiPP family leader peptide-containing protein [Acidimicrobiales bacterium]
MRAGYQPPRLTVLGTVTELTRGVVPTTTDGVLPGSIL